MTLEARLILLAQAIGTDVKTLTTAQGTLASLTTTEQSNLVGAINEMNAAFAARLNDGSTTVSTTEVWSANKITAVVEAAKTAVTDSILDGAGTALDTLNELALALGEDANFATTMTTALAARLRFDAAQVLSAPEKVQANANLGSVSLVQLGDPDSDFATTYATAKA
jgi:hypothetical protein